MATKEKVRTWTDEDERIANAFLEILKGYHGKNFSEKFALYRNNAARTMGMGYNLYNHLPDGAKKFISHLGGKKGGRSKKPEKLPPPETKEQRWLREVDQHGLHPEDEAHIIDNLSKSD